MSASTDLVQFLRDNGPINDPTGRMTSKLALITGHSAANISSTLGSLDKEGTLKRELNGKRTYKIWLKGQKNHKTTLVHEFLHDDESTLSALAPGDNLMWAICKMGGPLRARSDNLITDLAVWLGIDYESINLNYWTKTGTFISSKSGMYFDRVGLPGQDLDLAIKVPSGYMFSPTKISEIKHAQQPEPSVSEAAVHATDDMFAAVAAELLKQVTETIATGSPNGNLESAAQLRAANELLKQAELEHTVMQNRINALEQEVDELILRNGELNNQIKINQQRAKEVRQTIGNSLPDTVKGHLRNMMETAPSKARSRN